MPSVIAALIDDRLMRGMWIAMVTLLAVGSTTYTVIQLHAVDALTSEQVKLHAEVEDLNKRLTTMQAKLADRLTSLEQTVLVTQQKK